MGTVGLSFGSPTSGTGFNVSSTVAEIVGNLQNVEKPWKTQLTKLESQDTAISNLGTLLSNLSNDVSALTDFSSNAVMALKAVSSSDDNVLEITAATSSTVAGTHTVVVKNLATTSTGYLAPISDASDTLSGSITLQVGNGTAQTISLPAVGGTLDDLKDAINSSGVGITASILTDASGSRLSLVSGTSGAGGDITVSADSIIDDTNHLNYSGAAGTSTTPSTGTLTGIANTADTLSGSISIQVGNGQASTIDIGSTDNTLDGLAKAINGVTSLGVTASVVSNGDGTSSLQLVSNTADAAGTLTVTSSIVDTSTPSSTSLGYTSPSGGTGKNAQLTVDGVDLTSASNTVADLIPGVTFQLLAPSATESDGSPEQVQVVIGNNNTGIESTVNTMVSDYNSLISAMNTQEGNDSSGNPEPLFGSPTLSLLQQQLLGGLNAQNPNGVLDSVTANTNTTLAGSMTITVGGGAKQTFTVGDGTNDPTAGTYFTGSGVNTLSGLANAINAANIGVTASVVTSNGESTLTLSSQTAGSSGALSLTSAIAATSDTQVSFTGSQYSGGTLSGISSKDDTLSGSFNMSLDSGASDLNITLDSSDDTLSSLADYINASNFGVTASVVATGTGSNTSYGLSVVANNGETLAVSANVTDPGASANLLPFTSAQTSGGVFSSVAKPGDVLTGSVSVQVGDGAPQTFSPPFTSDSTTENTIGGLAAAINAANMGVTASIVTNNDGSQSLSLLSGTSGSAGDLTVNSTLLDTTNTSTKTLNYTNSSDISTLANLGISINSQYNGTVSFDVATLDSVLNSDFSSVVGFFQNVDSWGMTFSNMLNSAGTSSTTGGLSLAEKSNSSLESTLNADISKEESVISAQQANLTAELNSANEIMQELPSQLQGVNELYSAITGYNQGSNG